MCISAHCAAAAIVAPGVDPNASGSEWMSAGSRDSSRACTVSTLGPRTDLIVMCRSGKVFDI